MCIFLICCEVTHNEAVPEHPGIFVTLPSFLFGYRAVAAPLGFESALNDTELIRNIFGIRAD